MATDPAQGAIDAVVAYLDAALVPGTLGAVLDGWPEHGTDLDVSGLPVVSVTDTDTRRTDVSARIIDSSTVDDVTTYTYRVAELEVELQIDVWSAYKDQATAIIDALTNALTGTPPKPPVLHLTSTGYYNRPLACHLSDWGRARPDGDAAATGRWVRTAILTVQTDLVRTTTHPVQTRVDGDLTVDDGAVETIPLLA